MMSLPLEININITDEGLLGCVGFIAAAWICVTIFRNM